MFRRVLLAGALSIAGLGATVIGSGAGATAPANPLPAAAQPQSDYGLCVGNAPLWFLNFCEL